MVDADSGPFPHCPYVATHANYSFIPKLLYAHNAKWITFIPSFRLDCGPVAAAQAAKQKVSLRTR